MDRLHPQMAHFVAKDYKIRKKFGIDQPSDASLPKLRKFSQMVSLIESSAPIHQTTSLTIPGAESDIPIRIYTPSNAKKLPILMWFHGGGWVVGSPSNCDDLCRKLAHQTECIVISVDYHLAPEAQFPIAVEDCFAATLWAKNHASEFGGDASRIAVAGESAGGNLAACTAIKCRDEKLPLVFQLLLYPVIDSDFNRPSYLDFSDGLNLTRDEMIWFWDCYVPNRQDRTNPLVAPIHADDLSGLPPALIITAECDPLADEGAAYADALQSAGTPTAYHSYPGMIHGFFNLPTKKRVPAIEESFTLAVSALKNHFLRTPPTNP